MLVKNTQDKIQILSSIQHVYVIYVTFVYVTCICKMCVTYGCVDRRHIYDRLALCHAGAKRCLSSRRDVARPRHTLTFLVEENYESNFKNQVYKMYINEFKYKLKYHSFTLTIFNLFTISFLNFTMLYTWLFAMFLLLFLSLPISSDPFLFLFLSFFLGFNLCFFRSFF